MEGTTRPSALTAGRSAAPIVVTMWKYTRLIVLTAVCAALYAVALNILQTPPPLSTYFVGELLPQPLSHMFGPAAAFGLSIGQLVSAFVSGQLQIGNLFGMLDNFLLGLLPFMMWTRLRPLATGSRDVSLTNPRKSDPGSVHACLSLDDALRRSRLVDAISKSLLARATRCVCHSRPWASIVRSAGVPSLSSAAR